MRRLCVVALSLALGLAAVQAAGPPGAGAQPGGVDDTQDVLYVGPPHPVLLRLHLYVDGQSVFARWDAFMDKLFRLLDRNGSGGLDRTEAARAPQAQQMQQILGGNLLRVPAGRAVPGRGAPEMDADRDGQVTADEFKDHYRKNGCGPVSAAGAVNGAVLRASASVALAGRPAAGVDALSDALFALLDADKDGKLSRAELEAAQRALMRLDGDDNELVSQQEVGGGGATTSRQRQIEELEAIIRLQQAQLAGLAGNLLLVPRDDQGRRMTGQLSVARNVITRYDKDKNGKLSREEIAFPPRVFDQFDRNKDGQLDALELARWAAQQPAGEFTLSLGAATAVMRQPRRGPAAPARGPDMRVDLEGVRINIVPRPGGTTARTGPLLEQQFRLLDRDKQGFLTRRQVETEQQGLYLRGVFDLADQNGDNRITQQELKAVQDALAGASAARVNLSLAFNGQGLFQALDTSSDGQLSVREMRNSWGRLSPYDRDGDGAITRNEFPRQFVLSVGPGATSGVATLPAFAPGVADGRPRPVAAGRGPLWFHKMDRNGDGDVSRAEWLGSKEDFDRADADRDGLLSPEEAAAFDAKMRKSE